MKQKLIEVYLNYDSVLLSNRGYNCILIFSFQFVFKPLSAYKKPCFAKASRDFALGPHWGCLQRALKPPSCSGGVSEMLNHPLHK